LEYHSERFRLIFNQKAGRLTGTFISLGQKASRGVKKLTATKPDLSTYRMEISDNCWNIGIEGDTMSGYWNGGPCAPTGIGVGARLIRLEAKRMPTELGK
jgi:hypothetical protein